MKLTRIALAGILLLAGCAAKRIDLTKPHLAIPIPDCVDKVLAASPDSTCDTVERPPDVAKCRGTFYLHFICTKVSKGKAQ